MNITISLKLNTSSLWNNQNIPFDIYNKIDSAGNCIMHDPSFLANKECFKISDCEIIGLDEPWIKAYACYGKVLT